MRRCFIVSNLLLLQVNLFVSLEYSVVLEEEEEEEEEKIIIKSV